MSVTQTRLFDPVVFDDNVFDTRTNYLVTLEETRQLFDEAVFDSNVFDINRGGVVDFTDSVVRQLASQRSISESISIGQTITRVLASLRSITESSTINFTDSVLGVLGALRTPLESIAVSASVNYITPTVVRRIFDKGRLFDLNVFDNAIFDTNIKSYEITDSVARSDIYKETITEPVITLSDSVSRIA